MQISKSEYMMFLKHPAWLWLKKHDKKKLPPPDDNLQAMFDAGNKFEAYAEQLFPAGTRLGFDSYDEYKTLPDRTTKALQDGATTIFQGRFEYEQLTFICDVIQVVGGKEVDLFEIKSSTRVKLDHELDLAFQLVVLEGCGFTVRNIAVVHVNNEYTRQGAIDVPAFTITADITESVKARRDQTKRDIQAALQVVGEPTMPDPSPARCKLGSLKEWIDVYIGLATVEPGSIYDLTRISPETIGLLQQDGVEQLADIPDGFALSDKQALQLRATKLGEPMVQPRRIAKFLDSLVYPLYFFDYETMASVVPYFDGMKPYKQYPFQYSLHVLESPGADLRHMAYLHAHNTNPAQPLSQELRDQIGSSGSVITWNMSFEMGCNTLVGAMLPEYREFYEQLNSRVVDLMLPFANGWYADGRFKGSASIKNVLPVLVPSLSYKELGIQEGAGAQRLWMEAVLDGAREGQKDQILADLDEYCKLDTLAMVEIWRFLTKLVGGATDEPKATQIAMEW